MSETGVKSNPAFCLGPTIEKTNSVGQFLLHFSKLRIKTDLSYSTTKYKTNLDASIPETNFPSCVRNTRDAQILWVKR